MRLKIVLEVNTFKASESLTNLEVLTWIWFLHHSHFKLLVDSVSSERKHTNHNYDKDEYDGNRRIHSDAALLLSNCSIETLFSNSPHQS